MPDTYISGRFEVSGLPHVGDTLRLGLEGTPVVFTFVSSVGSPALQSQIVIGDSPNPDTLAGRIADAINATDTNCYAEVAGSVVNITPPTGLGVIVMSTQAENIAAVLVDMSPSGVIRSG